VKASLEGLAPRLGKDGVALYEQSGYGRPDKNGLRLSPQEALYLVHRQKIVFDGHSFDTLFCIFGREQNFLRSYLVYRDLRERGYVVQTGPHDFRVFKRGEKPGKGESLYFVRVLSERDPIVFTRLIEDATASRNMRKIFILAVVDDEDELTYYEIKLQKSAGQEMQQDMPQRCVQEQHRADLIGRSALVRENADSDLERMAFGKRLDPERLLLGPLEVHYLMKMGVMEVRHEGRTLDRQDFFAMVQETDREFSCKDIVYSDLRERGLIPRTGYKFGHHFRVYSGKNVHSDMLVHAVEKDAAMPMSLISRSVRMAHSVKKKMLFGCVHSNGIQFVEFARIKL
jgi:tRNA-intron endonuclease